MAALTIIRFCVALNVFAFISCKPWTQQTENNKIFKDESPLCHQSNDLIIVIDSSGTALPFWNDTIDSVQTFQSYFQIGDNETRIGVIDYSAVVNVHKHLDANNTNEETFTILERLRNHPQNGITNASIACEIVIKLFESTSPVRSDSRKAVIWYTDDVDQIRTASDRQMFMEYLRSSNTDAFVVNVSKDYTLLNLLEISESWNDSINATRPDRTGNSKQTLNQTNTASSSNHSSEGNQTLGRHMFMSLLLHPQADPRKIQTATDKAESLYSHNYVRALHGVPPLEWSDELASEASNFAYKLAQENKIHHSGMKYGENIYMAQGSTSYVHSHQALLDWYETVSVYDFDKSAFDYNAGTFTQVVWKDTKELGVGIAYHPDTKSTVIVALYKPVGNTPSKFKENVLKPLRGLPARIPTLKELLPPRPTITTFINNGDKPNTDDVGLKPLAQYLCSKNLT